MSRLEEIKQKDVIWLKVNELKKDWDWLIQQGEWVAELEEENKKLKEFQNLWHENMFGKDDSK